MKIEIDLTGVEAKTTFDPLPPGDYNATIENSEVKSGSKGDYIIWTFQIDDKPNKVWDIMSLAHSVGLSRLRQLAEVSGHYNPNYIRDTEELHGLRCIVRLKIEQDDQYAPKNKITGFKKIKKENTNKIQFNKHDSLTKKMPWEQTTVTSEENSDMPF